MNWAGKGVPYLRLLEKNENVLHCPACATEQLYYLDIACSHRQHNAPIFPEIQE